MSIHRKAWKHGHVWTDDELRQQGLPLFWNETWVRRRLDEGATRAELAIESGFPERTVVSYLQKIWGIRAFYRSDQSVKELMRARVAAGLPRSVIAQELGLSEPTVGKYARSLPGEEQRKFNQVVKQVPSWPATRMQIAQAAFGGDGSATSAWLRYKVRRGWLVRQQRGLYALPEENGSPPPASPS